MPGLGKRRADHLSMIGERGSVGVGSEIQNRPVGNRNYGTPTLHGSGVGTTARHG